jgi:hypothetical protein
MQFGWWRQRTGNRRRSSWGCSEAREKVSKSQGGRQRAKRLTKMFKVGKMGHSILGFSAGHSIKYGLSKVQAIACEIPVSNQTGMGKAPAIRE